MSEDIIIEDNISIDLKKEAITSAMNKVEYIPSYPIAEDENKDLTSYTKLSLTSLSAVGTGLESIAPAISNAMAQAGMGGEVLYKATLKPGTHLAELSDGSGFISTMVKDGKGIVGQAPLNPVGFNPTALFMAAALAGIEKKMDAIQETQKEMFDFLKQRQEAELESGLSMLAAVLNNYKYNWDNEKFKDANYNKILDIKQQAETGIRLYRKQIIEKDKQNKLFYSNAEVDRKTAALNSDFKNYRFALHLYSFASFLDVMLLENFREDYLNSISSKLDVYEADYLKLYIGCYKKLKEYSNKSLEHLAVKGASAIANRIEKSSSKAPDENYINISIGDRLERIGKNKSNKAFFEMIDEQLKAENPFVNNIKLVNKLYNEPLNIMFDKNSIYLQLPT